mmetsp:Transcript_9291/g.9369  ORF Transcript_9291/g.9369 Transcript_9291/m.9369 type:complete len:235 (+) Transcript_9291:54-758(+)
MIFKIAICRAYPLGRLGRFPQSLSYTTSRKSMRARVTIAEAQSAKKQYNTLTNESLLLMAIAGDQKAREERFIRDIMAVDEIEWNAASDKFISIKAINCEWMFLATLPYKVGLFSSLTIAFASIPMIFDKKTVVWFNNNYVTAEVPDPKDLQTWLEVGSWAWNWMEPVLGHISFVLLCLQFARSQMKNLHWSPYSDALAERRASRLHARFPMYDENIVKDFARNDTFDTKKSEE